tara:strand:+ start:247 stop:1239 length:993 start_codon:yes stop_codon:yes gene_type:complete
MTEQRPIQPTPVGALRFNTDSSKLEYFDGNQYVNITTDSPEQNTGGTRGLFGAGHPATNKIDFINIDTTGNAQDFGDRTTGNGNQSGACSSRVRGLFAGGHPNHDVIDFVTIASTGDAIDFGNLADACHGITGFSDRTRGMFSGGTTPTLLNTIQFVTMSSTGNTTDFGDINTASRNNSCCASPTRGVILIAGYANTIEFVTISTTGNAADFGDTTFTGGYGAGCSNAVRGLFMEGNATPSSRSTAVDFITIATLGNGLDFGDLTDDNSLLSATASSTRAVRAGGQHASSEANIIDYAQIMTTGNFIDFGDLTGNYGGQGGCSNGHGGLG